LLACQSRSWMVRVLVLPGSFVLTISQGRVAKKKPPVMRSRAWSIAQESDSVERRR
jgi:hypothetical protein